jgi:hypothetical protein
MILLTFWADNYPWNEWGDPRFVYDHACPWTMYGRYAYTRSALLMYQGVA